MKTHIFLTALALVVIALGVLTWINAAPTVSGVPVRLDRPIVGEINGH